MDSNMAGQRATLTKSILSDYSGYVLDIPNGNENILDSKTQNQCESEDNPNQQLLHQL